jgi:hypothetical protein
MDFQALSITDLLAIRVKLDEEIATKDPITSVKNWIRDTNSTVRIEIHTVDPKTEPNCITAHGVAYVYNPNCGFFVSKVTTNIKENEIAQQKLLFMMCEQLWQELSVLKTTFDNPVTPLKCPRGGAAFTSIPHSHLVKCDAEEKLCNVIRKTYAEILSSSEEDEGEVVPSSDEEEEDGELVQSSDEEEEDDAELVQSSDEEEAEVSDDSPPPTPKAKSEKPKKAKYWRHRK